MRDDKAGSRIDANTRFGQISGYYCIDDYSLDNPYPGQQGGATIPGFDALTAGRVQEWSIGNTKVFGATLVNELRAGFLRNVNDIGQPHGGLGVSLQSQGLSPASEHRGSWCRRRSLKGWKISFFRHS